MAVLDSVPGATLTKKCVLCSDSVSMRWRSSFSTQWQCEPYQPHSSVFIIHSAFIVELAWRTNMGSSEFEKLCSTARKDKGRYRNKFSTCEIQNSNFCEFSAMLLICSFFSSFSLEPEVREFLLRNMLKWLPWGKSQCSSMIHLCDNYHSLAVSSVCDATSCFLWLFPPSGSAWLILTLYFCLELLHLWLTVNGCGWPKIILFPNLK